MYIPQLQTLSFFGDTAVDMLQSALDFWRDILQQLFSILTVSPKDFLGGSIWTLIEGIFHTLQAVGVSLMVVFFFYGIIKSTVSFRDLLQRPTQIIGYFIRIVLADFLIIYGLDFLLWILTFIQDLITMIQASTPVLGMSVPAELADALSNASFWQSIGSFCGALVGTLLIYLFAVIVIAIVYGRFFKIFLLTAIAPLPMATIAGEATESIGVNYIKSYTGECLRGVLILVACRIFSVFATTPPQLDPTASVAAMTWAYIAQVSLNMLILVIVVKTSDRMMKEIFGI